PPTDKARRGRPMLVGMLAGVAVLGGALAAAWFVPPARQGLMDVLGVEAKKPPAAGGAAGAQAVAAAPARPTPLQTAHDLMDKGDYAEAVKTLEDQGNEPEVAAARSQARWLKYLQ